MNADALKESGMSEADILSMRLDLLKQIEKANDNINSKTQAAISNESTLANKTAREAARTAGSLSAMFDALGGEGERYAEFAKALGVMQVAIQEGVAIANAWSGNAKLPWPANILATAASVASIIAAIASAMGSVKSTDVPKYASGGLVTGPGTGTSDSVPAMLSNGEAVMTAAAVNEWGAMLSAMNIASGGNAINVSNLPQRGDGMRGMRAMLKEALLDMPAPVVSVVDINKGQRRVKVQDNISKLGRKKYK